MHPFVEGSKSALRGFRYIAGFLILNFVLAWVGTGPFRAGASEVMGHSLLGQRLLSGFDLSALTELLVRPELGTTMGVAGTGLNAALLFALASVVFMPGVLMAFAAGGRVPREAFFGACGRNVWRFVRLTLLFAVAGGLLAILLGLAAKGAVTAANRSTHEQLAFWVGLGASLVILAAMTFLRLWFDLAQAHVVVRDQKAVGRALAAAFRKVRACGVRLLGFYLLVTLLAVAAAAIGLRLWSGLVPPGSVFGAFIASEAILLLLLAARFWQRAAAVAVVTEGP